MKPILAWLATSVFGLTTALAGPLFEPVAAFQAGPTGPEGGTLLKHSDGFFYGTSRAGGAYGHGCLYRVSGLGEVRALVHFTGSAGPARGRRPQGGLVDDGTGILWGTTFQGGAGNSGDGFGTVFRFNPISWDFTSVVEFSGTAGFAKGSFPQAGLAWDGAGQLWGTTSSGGAGGHGTVFRVNPVTLGFTSVLDFTGAAGANRGRNPLAGLTFGGAGALWGTTVEGGSGAVGTLFSVATATGLMTTRFDFTGAAGAFRGSRPLAPLVVDSGAVWGTSSTGGLGGFGTIFRYTVSGGGFAEVASFTGPAGSLPGRTPMAGLVADGAGNFYGTTNAGGPAESGTIYKINKNTSVSTPVQSFTGNSGAVPGSLPSATLAADGSGNLWGVTTGGGQARLGTIYKINAGTGAYASVADFQRSTGTVMASNPAAGLTSGGDGLLWGSTEKGGSSDLGMLFTLNPATGVVQRVLDFSGTGGATAGAGPSAELVADGNGFLWGVTAAGGANNGGVVFKINVLSRIYTLVLEFNGSNGRIPLGRLLADGAGNFWGTTSEGGPSQRGTVFRIAMATGVLTTLLEFTGSSGSFLGDGPAGGLSSDGAGFFWGTTYEGGSSNAGTIFKIATATGAFTSVFSFDGDGSLGKAPGETLTLAADGFFWGATEFGGAEDLGIVFKINRSTGVFTRILDFTGKDGEYPGANPRSSLIQDPVGAWYGSTQGGGSGEKGTIFKIAPSGAFSIVTNFTGALGTTPGERPRGNFMRHTDGNFYATTAQGGAVDFLIPGGNGSIFKLRFGPIPVTQPATLVQSTTVTLNAQVNPNGAASAVSYEYSTSASLAGAPIVSGGTTLAATNPLAAPAAVTGLLPSRTYYYRARALNPENANLQLGAVLTFTTPAASGGSGFASWLGTMGLSGGAEMAAVDSDLDGTPNALEYMNGTNPAVADGGAPAGLTYSVAGNNLIVNFTRRDASETADITLRVEAGNGLGAWTSSYAIGATTATSDGGVMVVENGSNPDDIQVTIPTAGSSANFARLKVNVGP